MQYHYRRGEQQFGPVPLEALVAEARSGAIDPNDLVWAEGWNTWRIAQAVPGLFPRMAVPAKPIGADPTMRLLLPVGRSFWAIAAGYLGLVSILVLPAPFALVTGILAVLDIKKNPEKHGMGRAIFGIVMGGIFTGLLVLATIMK
ncbi:MAG: GYF domain-containing protein [Arenimonas sp.]